MTREQRWRRIGWALGEILTQLDVLLTPEPEEVPDVEAEFTEPRPAPNTSDPDPDEKPSKPPPEEPPTEYLESTQAFGASVPGTPY